MNYFIFYFMLLQMTVPCEYQRRLCTLKEVWWNLKLDANFYEWLLNFKRKAIN